MKLITKPLGKSLPEQSCCLPGRKPVLELAKHAPHRLVGVYIRQGVKLDQELKLQLTGIPELPIYECVPEVFAEFPSSVTSQGIIGVFVPESIDLETLLTKGIDSNAVILICDQVQDPQNLGALIRAAEALGAIGVIVTKDNSSPMSPAVRKASAGAAQLIPVVAVTNLQRALEDLKKRGFWVYGAALEQSSESLFQVSFNSPTAIVVGSEGKGIRTLTRKMCDVLVSIPMAGKVESLNVSQAASIILFELLRRRMDAERSN